MTTTSCRAPWISRRIGIDPTGRVYRNPSTALLYSHALARGDGRLAGGGSLVVDTGKFTGRSPKDKFLVDEPSSTDRIWWGEVEPEARRVELRRAPRQGHGAPRGRRSALRDRRVGGRGPRAPDRCARRHRAPVPRALREDDVHRSDRERARLVPAGGGRAAHAGSRGRSRRGRDAHLDGDRAASRTDGAARPRDVLCG